MQNFYSNFKPVNRISNQIVINTRPVNDPHYVALDTNDNKRINEFQIDNLRTLDYTKNPCYLFPRDHKFYDLQGIDEGKGPGMDPDLDSVLTRGHIVPLPADRLQEKVTFIRYVDFLPPINRPIYHNKFLVSTSIPVDPQINFEPEFDIYGVGTKNYQRLSDEYFRTVAGKSNCYRVPSKYVKCLD